MSNFSIRFFWHQPYLVTTPPTGFLRFKKSIFKDIWEINYFFDFLDVFTPSLQVWWIFVENWWRNNLSKLTTFNPVFQLQHSAMYNLIRCVYFYTTQHVLIDYTHSNDPQRSLVYNLIQCVIFTELCVFFSSFLHQPSVLLHSVCSFPHIFYRTQVSLVRSMGSSVSK